MHTSLTTIIARVLVLIGAINWGFVGLGKVIGNVDWNLVHMLLGRSVLTESLVYIAVGLGGVYFITELAVSRKS